MGKRGPAPAPRHLKVVEGNPGHESAADLEPGLVLPPDAPAEPDWQQWWPTVRIPAVSTLEKRWPLDLVEGSLIHIEHDGKRRALAKARRKWMVAQERDQARRSQKTNRRAREVAREEWRRVVPVLDAKGLLASIDRTVLVDYVVTWAQIDQCVRDIAERGIWVQGERGAVKNPSSTMVNQLRDKLKWHVGRLGLSPVDRDQLKPPGDHDGQGTSVFD